MARFEMDRYRIPSGNTGSSLALSRSLIAAGDKDAGPQVKTALKKVHAAALATQEAWKRADAVATGDARAADNVIDNAHAALEIRLQTYAWLASELDADDVEQAKEIHAKLDGQGMSFLKLPFAEEWAESEKRLQRMTDEGLRPTLERLVGKPFVEALFRRTPNTASRSTIDAAMAMLRPVDVYRSRVLAGRGAGGGDVVPPDATNPADPSAPAPAAPGGAPAQEAPSAPIPPVK